MKNKNQQDNKATVNNGRQNDNKKMDTKHQNQQQKESGETSATSMNSGRNKANKTSR